MKLALAILLATLTPALAAMPRPQAEWLASAIYYAEGGTNSARPYGLKQGTRLACLHRLDREWDNWLAAGHPGLDFVAWIGQTWAPVGVDDDPRSLNVNWQPNVRRLYLKRVK